MDIVPSTPAVVSLLRHQHLIVTIYGLYAREHGGVLAVSDLINLLGALGVEAASVRSSVSRLKKRGVLVRPEQGGLAAYQLATELEEVFRAGDKRIFSPRRARERDDWILTSFSIPESQRHLRHQLRTILTRTGCGQVSAGLWIAPGHMAEEVALQLERAGLIGYVDLFRGTHLGDVEISATIGRWWDLDSMGARYDAFLINNAGILARWSAESSAGSQVGQDVLRHAFADYVVVLTQWRRLPYVDPGLPVAYLPQDWAGLAAERLFADVHEKLSGPAREHAMSVLG